MTLRELLWASVAGIALSGAGCDRDSKVSSQLAPPASPAAAPSEVSIEDRIRDTILSYMSEPKFAGSRFTQQVTGTQAELEMLHVDERMLYFSIPIRSYDQARTLGLLTKRPEAVEFGQPEGSRLHLGKYYFSEPGKHFFRFPEQDFRVDPQKVLSFPIGSVTYTITPQELADFISNTSVYGGRLNVKFEDTSDGLPVIFSNHGAFVVKQGESSLRRLAEKITRSSKTREQKAQALLDFVSSRRIRYDSEPGDSGTEVLQRPNEVLMTREGDCSGKVILYASLLEQAGIDYRIAYVGVENRANPDHISVAVRGRFHSTNGMSFTFGDQSFFFAETTIPGFKIGRTQPETPYSVRNMIGYQKPGKNAPIYDAATGKSLPFF